MVDRLDEQSRHAGQTRTQLTKTLLEEGLRMEAHPGIVFRSGPAGRRPGLAGGPDIWEVARLFRSRHMSRSPNLNAIADELSLSMNQVRAALGYYADYKNEVDQWIEQLDREADQLLAAFERQQALLRD
ncbi:MAG TPA: CopG family transcriptional regulator [Chloroflexota bacterium]|nr:CopG family transcriptional regulator [Chloroflexota bacterium]